MFLLGEIDSFLTQIVLIFFNTSNMAAVLYRFIVTERQKLITGRKGFVGNKYNIFVS